MATLDHPTLRHYSPVAILRVLGKMQWPWKKAQKAVNTFLRDHAVADLTASLQVESWCRRGAVPVLFQEEIADLERAASA